MSTIAITTSSFDVDHLPEELRSLEVVLNPHGRALTEPEVLELLAADVLGVIAGVEPLTDRVMDGAGSLRAIARLGTGLDNVDLDAAERRGIVVSATPDAPVDAVAELTIALMLAVLRSIPASDAAVRGGGWPRPRGRLLGERVVGLIGGGRIGAGVARRLEGFGCDVLVADPYLSSAPSSASLVGVDRLIAEADLVSLHVPLTEQNRHLIDAERIARMRPGTIVVNVARGGLVDEGALEAALRSGHLGGAAVDTFETEPYAGSLGALDNVVLSPHAGSSTIETRRRMEIEAAANLLRDLHECGAL